jgi:hypothetical protein
MLEDCVRKWVPILQPYNRMTLVLDSVNLLVSLFYLFLFSILIFFDQRPEYGEELINLTRIVLSLMIIKNLNTGFLK